MMLSIENGKDCSEEGLTSFILRIGLFLFFTHYVWILILRGYVSGYVDLSILGQLKPYVEEQFLGSAFSRFSGFLWVLIIYGIWLKFFDCKKRNPNLLIPKTSIIKSYALGIGLAWGTFITILFIYYFSGIFEVEGIKTTFLEFLLNLIVVWILSTFTSVTEELICRGYLLNRFCERVNPHIAVLCQGIIFSLMHWNFYRGIDINILATTFLGGFILGYLFLLTGNLWSCIGMHTGIHLMNVFLSPRTVNYQLQDYPYHALFGSNLFGLGGQTIFFILLIILICLFTCNTGREVEPTV